MLFIMGFFIAASIVGMIIFISYYVTELSCTFSSDNNGKSLKNMFLLSLKEDNDNWTRRRGNSIESIWDEYYSPQYGNVQFVINCCTWEKYYAIVDNKCAGIRMFPFTPSWFKVKKFIEYVDRKINNEYVSEINKGFIENFNR